MFYFSQYAIDARATKAAIEYSAYLASHEPRENEDAKNIADAKNASAAEYAEMIRQQRAEYAAQFNMVRTPYTGHFAARYRA